MELEKVYLDWTRPLLWQIVDFLLAKSPDFNFFELNIVCSSKRAERRLIELLTTIADSENSALIPPKFYASITEFLTASTYPFKAGLPSKIESLALWLKVLADNENKTLLGQEIDEDIAIYLSDLHNELSRANISPDEVIAVVASSKQKELWQELSILIKNFESNLDSLELSKDLHSVTTNDRLILISPLEISTLEATALTNSKVLVESLIFAPLDRKSGFDEFGAIVPEYWQKVPLQINSDQIIIKDSPLDQYQECVSLMKESNNIAEANTKITITTLDPVSIGPLETLLTINEIKAVAPGTRSLMTSSWGILALLVFKYWSEEQLSFKDLLLHPLIEKSLDLKLTNTQWSDLDSNLEILEKLEKYLPSRPAAGSNPVEYFSSIQAFFNLLAEEIYGENSEIDIDPYYQQVRLVIQNLVETKTFHKLNLNLSGAERILREVLNTSPAHGESSSPISILGLYETFWDDSLQIIINDCTEEFLPGSRKINPFLTESVRKTLKMRGQYSNEAQSSYLLNSILNSRPSLKLLIPRLNSRNEPARISKFLVLRDQFPNMEILKTYYGESLDDQNNNQESINASSPSVIYGAFKPKTTNIKAFPLKSISPTQLVDYLICPYNFYLRHILNLKLSYESSFEIPENICGTIIHDTISTLTKLLGARKEFNIENFKEKASIELRQRLSKQSKNNISTSVDLQIRSLESRLDQYLEFELESRSNGYLPERTEYQITNNSLFSSYTGENIIIKSVLDRLEKNDSSGRYRIIDFKTRNNTSDFKKVLKDKLQIQIYGIIAQSELKINSEDIELLLVNLNEDGQPADKKVEFSNDTQLQILSHCNEALEGISEGMYWPPRIKNSALIQRLFALTDLCDEKEPSMRIEGIV